MYPLYVLCNTGCHTKTANFYNDSNHPPLDFALPARLDDLFCNDAMPKAARVAAGTLASRVVLDPYTIIQTENTTSVNQIAS